MTVIVQVAAGASAPQVVLVWNAELAFDRLPTCAEVDPVLVTVMACRVAEASGTLLKTSAFGLKAIPGSGAPLPVSVAETTPVPVWTLTVPVRAPVAIGAKTTEKKQEAFGASVPVQAAPPFVWVLRAKSPVSAGVASETAVPLVAMLVSVKSWGALDPLTVTGPKFALTGESTTPEGARPLPVSARLYALPEVEEASESVAVCAPVPGGVNCTPSQQLTQLPVVAERKEEAGNCPWPLPVSSTRSTLKVELSVAAVSVVKGCETLYHCTEGWPTVTLPKSSVPLLEAKWRSPCR